MIKAVLFDLDGTLLNRDESVRVFCEKQYERLRKFVSHIPKQQYIMRFIELDNRGYVWKDRVYQQIVEEFEIKGLAWEELLQDYLENFKESCVPFPNLIEVLEELKAHDLKLGMITNGKGQFQMDTIIALGIDPYLDVILISEWEGLRKPEPEIFQKALKKLSVLASECVFVGDHPVNDVKAARSVGMKGVWKKDTYWDCVEADYVVEELGELPQYIRLLNEECFSK